MVLFYYDCAIIQNNPEERIEGRFYVSNMMGTQIYSNIAKAFYLSLNQKRYVSHITVHCDEDVKNIDIYARINQAEWVLIEQTKKPIKHARKFRISRKCDSIRIIQKTVTDGIGEGYSTSMAQKKYITNIEAFGPSE